MGKREYNEARKRANEKYSSRTYKAITIRLRLEDDVRIIESWERAKAEGVSNREWLRSFGKDED